MPKAPAPRREIPGNLPYLVSPGSVKSVLDRVVEAQRPDKFNADFLENVLNMKGGTSRSAIGLLKKMGFLHPDGTPSEIYAKFKTTGGKSFAAYQGLKNAYPEIFRKSIYAYNADDNKLTDLIVEITGLQRSDPIARYIKGTFNAIRSFITSDPLTEGGNESPNNEELPAAMPARPDATLNHSDGGGIRLAYNINIVLPETSDLNVLNAIFRSLKENLLR